MITVKRFEVNMLQENCYVVSDDSNEAVVIDCGAYFEEERQAIVDYINNHRLTVRHLLCTHAHFDHCFGNDTIWRAFGIRPSVPLKDEWLTDIDSQMQAMMGTSYNRETAPVGQLYTEADHFDFGNHRLTVIHTPGHTPGSSLFYCEQEQAVFTGDTLFRLSIGRTDFEGGSWTDMQRSLHRVAQLPADTRVYPGHGPETTIGAELRSNPYLR